MEIAIFNDAIWILICAIMVMMMQAGFTCLESGLVRAKNSINVAIKNFIDFCIAATLFWGVGYGFMFGVSAAGWIGTDGFFFNEQTEPWLLAFFLFQLTFCGTATTLVSGAVAERMRFSGYLIMAMIISCVIYPVIGHWVWGGAPNGTPSGWLASKGFLDFAGSTVVHSTGGWVALAAILLIGPRLGRFGEHAVRIQGQDLPLATLGTFLLWIGWMGFNGGSTFHLAANIPLILVNTTMAGATGALIALAISWHRRGYPDVLGVMNGALAGLVGITASAHIMSLSSSLIIGAVAGVISVVLSDLLEKLKIDDVIGAVPVHVGGGVWGTLAVALFSDPATWDTGLGRWEQLGVQAMGIGACFVWAFGGGFALLWLVNQWFPLRVSAESEWEGLNMSEHGASSALRDLLGEMDHRRQTGDFSTPVSVEPHTEIGQIALAYNRVQEKVIVETQQREHALQALTESEQQFRMLSEALPIGAFELDCEGHCIYQNHVCADIVHTSIAQPTNSVPHVASHHYWLQWFHPSIQSTLETKWQALLTEHKKLSVECQMASTHSRDRWVQVLLSPIISEQTVRYIGTLEDISERKIAEEALHKTLEEREEILSSISAIMIGIDKQGRIRQWNKVAEETFGIPFSSVRRQPFQLCGLEWDWQQVGQALERCQSTSAPVHLDSLTYQRSNETDGFVALTLNPLMSDDDPKSFKGILMLGKDITERKQLEMQLGLAQKMESIGQLAAGIAHEINTPTQFVSDNLRFLTESFTDIQKVLTVYDQVIKTLPREALDAQLLETMETTIAEADLEYVSEEIPKALQQSLDGSERVGKIVRAMKDFSHPGTTEKKPIDLNQAIESTITVARNEWKYVADVVTAFDPQMPVVPCLPGEFNQVILNLLINAAHAIEAAMGPEAEVKGTITVTTRMTESGAEIRVTDTGTGIPEAARKKLFDPFFTTKEVGKGTGQGLAIAHDVIVNKHGGTLTFESTIGVGATFIIQLPCEPIAV